VTRDDIGWRPTREEVERAAGTTVSDLVGPGLRVLLVGINPGLYSGATGHHFARPGNRFWKALHGGGFTPRLLSPHEQDELPSLGLGITNLVERATRGAQELSVEELRAGAERLREKVERLRPAWVAFLGVAAYRTALGRPAARVGPQEDRFAGARVWVLPNPSGLNAHYQLDALIEAFAALGAAVRRSSRGP
jgi:double-stranded uracil-DNA glycosylase